MQAKNPDPHLVALSVAAYRWLLGLYPQSFRYEYGPHMLQVFRDSAIVSVRRDGVGGLPPLWGRTLLDLVRTVAEEHMQRGVDMTRDTFIRLSGWGMIVGTVLLALLFSSALDESNVRLFLYNTLGIESTARNIYQIRTVASTVAEIVGVGALSLLTMGILGLQLRYGKQVGQLGEYSLWASFAGGAIATVIVMGWALSLYISFTWFFWSGFVMLFFLGLFGLVAIRHKPMKRGNWLPFLAGGPLSLVAAAAAVVEMTGGAWPDWGWMNTILPLLSAVALVLLGFILAEPTSEADSQGTRVEAATT